MFFLNKKKKQKGGGMCHRYNNRMKYCINFAIRENGVSDNSCENPKQHIFDHSCELVQVNNTANDLTMMAIFFCFYLFFTTYRIDPKQYV